MKWIYCLLAIAWSVNGVAQHNPASGSAKQPNIVFIMADDLSMRDIEPYGSSQVHTPNIARLAKEGLCLDNMFNVVPVCAPTRQSLLTGLAPVRNGAHPNHSEIYEGIKTLPTYLQNLGYNTALIGKRHYGPAAAYPFDFLGGREHDNGKGQDVDLSKAEDYILKSGDKPFFLMFTSNQPHEPWTRGDQSQYNPQEIQLGPNMVDTKLTRRSMANYFAEITYFDSLVGACLDMIDRTGNRENTLVMLATEQGNQFPFSKWTLYDQGLHSGFIVRWPGMVAPGTRNPALLAYTDVAPTLIEIAGGEPAKINTGSKDFYGNTGFDGSSFLNVLKGNTTHARDYVFGINTTRGIINGSDAYAIRSARDNRYLYIHNLNYDSRFKNVVTRSPMFMQWMATNSVRSMMYVVRPEEELYDIKTDPYQLHNLAADKKLATIKDKLKSELKAFMKQQKDKGIGTEMEAFLRQPRHEAAEGGG